MIDDDDSTDRWFPIRLSSGRSRPTQWPTHKARAASRKRNKASRARHRAQMRRRRRRKGGARLEVSYS